MSGYVIPVEVVTPSGTARHAALIPAGEARDVRRSGVAASYGVCGRAKNAKTLIRVDWLASCGKRENGPLCMACWRKVALDEGITT